MSASARASELEKIVFGVLNPDNNVRKQAEAALESFQRQYGPGNLLCCLTFLLKNASDVGIRQLGGVLLRQGIARKKLWPTCDGDSQTFVKNNLLEVFHRADIPRIVFRAYISAISKLGCECLWHKTWPELVPSLFKACQSQLDAHRAGSMDVFNELVEFALKPILELVPQMREVLTKCLQDSSKEVRIAALNATVSLLLSLPEEKLAFMEQCIPLMFQTVSQAPDEETIVNACASMTTFVGFRPIFFREKLDEIVTIMNQIASSNTLEWETRRAAFEFLLSLGDRGKGMIRKHSSYARVTTQLCFGFMRELDIDIDWTIEDEDEQVNFKCGLNGIQRLADCLGAKRMSSTAMPFITKLLESGDFRERHAALMSIANMVETCSDLWKDDFESLLRIVLPFMNDSHPRAKCATISCFCALAQFCADEVYKVHHIFMPQMVAALTSENHRRVYVESCRCIGIFCSNCEYECIEPYVDPLLAGILEHLKRDDIEVKEACLAVVAQVATAAETNFTKYYDHFVPGLIALLQTPDSPKTTDLKGNAMSCIGMIGSAVGAEKFGPDAKKIIDMLLMAQKLHPENDDPNYNDRVTLFTRMGQILKEQFIPYLEHVIPPLLRSAAKQSGSIIDFDDDTPASDPGQSVLTVDIRGVGKKKICFNSSILEEKATACNMLYQFCLELPAGFFRWVKDTAEILVPLIRFPYNESVRTAAISILPLLIKSANLGTGNGSDSVKQLFEFMWQPMKEGLELEPDLETQVPIIDTVNETLNAFGQPLAPEKLHELTKLIKELLKGSQERRAERKLLEQSEDFDEEEKEFIEMENEFETDYVGTLVDTVQSMVKYSKEQYIPIFRDLLADDVAKLLADDKSNGEKTSALCMYDDIMEFGGEPAQVFFDQFVPVLFRQALNPNEDIRQSACYGIGACAQASGQKVTKKFLDEALKVLMTVINDQNARADGHRLATDNAVASLGKICRHQSDKVDVNALISMWVTFLPVLDDDVEAPAVYSNLCYFMKHATQSVMGGNNVNFPKIVQIFAEVLDTDFVNKESQTDMVVFWKQMQQEAPTDFVQQCVASFPEPLQQKLMKYAN